MGNLFFWLGVGAAQKGAGSKPIEPRHWCSVVCCRYSGCTVECFFCWSATNNEAALKPAIGLNEQIFGVIKQISGRGQSD